MRVAIPTKPSTTSQKLPTGSSFIIRLSPLPSSAASVVSWPNRKMAGERTPRLTHPEASAPRRSDATLTKFFIA